MSQQIVFSIFLFNASYINEGYFQVLHLSVLFMENHNYFWGLA